MVAATPSLISKLMSLMVSSMKLVVAQSVIERVIENSIDSLFQTSGVWLIFESILTA